MSKVLSNPCCTGEKNLNFENSSYVYKLDSLYTTASLYDQDVLYSKCGKFSLSEKTKLILLDSLLKEVCISSDIDRLLTFECLCLSVTKYVIQG